MEVSLSLKRFFRARFRRLGFDIVRYRPPLPLPDEKDRFEYQKQFNQFHIAPGSVVLDIGGGHYPFPCATLLSDLYPEESPHRTERIVRDHRPFVRLDIHHLPFLDKSIDFVYCSHVLEHVANPFQACQEIMRVGKQGYIETPTFGKDALFGWAADIAHQWHVTAIDDTLVFFEYSDRQKRGICSPAWRDLIFADCYYPLQEAFYKNQDVFNTMFTWRHAFRFFVFRLDGTVETSDEPQISHSEH